MEIIKDYYLTASKNDGKVERLEYYNGLFEVDKVSIDILSDRNPERFYNYKKLNVDIFRKGLRNICTEEDFYSKYAKQTNSYIEIVFDLKNTKDNTKVIHNSYGLSIIEFLYDIMEMEELTSENRLRLCFSLSEILNIIYKNINTFTDEMNKTIKEKHSIDIEDIVKIIKNLIEKSNIEERSKQWRKQWEL